MYGPGERATWYAVCGGLLLMNCRAQQPPAQPTATTDVAVPAAPGDPAPSAEPNGTAATGEAEPAAAPRRVTEAEAESEVELAPAQELVVELTARPGAGYVWHVEASDLGEPTMEFADQGGTGEGGTTLQRFTWRAPGSGARGLLRLAYRRSVGTPLKTYELSFRVR